jgi:hypothetical protein
MDVCEVEVWALVTEDGEYEVSKDPSDLQAEAGLASRLVKLVVRVPVPRAVELVADLPPEPACGELRVA